MERSRQWESFSCVNVDSVHNDYQRHLLYLWAFPQAETQKLEAWMEQEFHRSVLIFKESDVDGDGIPDLVVGAHGDDDGGHCVLRVRGRHLQPRTIGKLHRVRARITLRVSGFRVHQVRERHDGAHGRLKLVLGL